MTTVTTDLVTKFWNLCNVLKDDGVTYHQYATELTYLLFLKMANEIGAEDQIPERHRWEDLQQLPGPELLESYKNTLSYIATYGSPLAQEIFANATSFIRKPTTLSTLLVELDKLDWYSAKQDGLGDLYEGLLQKNANEKKSGAGQYFTPRPLIDTIVSVTKPTLADIIQDPAAGTAGFLVAANHYIRTHTNPATWTPAERRKYRRNTFFGMEHVQDTHRLALMNLLLHDIASTPDAGGLRYGDTLGPEGQALPKATLILTNPPFGTKRGGGPPSRTDLPFPTSNKQLCFLQHIYGGLRPGGRAAVVVPDNVLFEGNVGKHIRADLMEKCNLHTILRLPTGIFYAQAVKTNVLFFNRAKPKSANTHTVWVYDLRTNMPQFGRRTALTRTHFADFELAYGADPLAAGRGPHGPEDMAGRNRFRGFGRQWIADRDDNLDISWLKDDSGGDRDNLPNPTTLATEAIDYLEEAIHQLRTIVDHLGERDVR